MKTVDRDLLIRKYIDPDIKKFNNSDVKIVLENLKQNILKMSVIDRPQGEWINKGAVCQCTCCKGYSRGLLEEKNGRLCDPHRLIYPQFCPNCGARMKGESDE